LKPKKKDEFVKPGEENRGPNGELFQWRKEKRRLQKIEKN